METAYNARLKNQPSVLLVGPTGAGKTPFGELCESKGLWGRRCGHFDFGKNLRLAAGDGALFPLLTSPDIAVIVNSLETGTLLENEYFPIAAKILSSFCEKKAINPHDLLLLNGLPRHEDQAIDISPLIDIILVVYLRCSSEVVYQRIATNSGGDRSGRKDDSLAEIEKKLRLFEKRTLPLLDYYRNRSVRIETVEVTTITSPEDIHEWLNAMDIEAVN